MRSSVAMLKTVKVLMNVRSSRPEVFYKKGVLKNFAKFTGKHLCQALAQMFSCEFFEISKNTFSYRAPPVAVSKMCKLP